MMVLGKKDFKVACEKVLEQNAIRSVERTSADAHSKVEKENIKKLSSDLIQDNIYNRSQKIGRADVY